ncbi:MAG TPA: biotin/lipoyl-binding protein [Burkholderiaceae bacterium]|nr:biotin/lipoyl-binding protein [Burkholderiaceae bacterium]
MRHAFLLDGIEHEVWLSHDSGRWRLHAGRATGDGVPAGTTDADGTATATGVTRIADAATGAAGATESAGTAWADGSGDARGTPIALDLAADGSGHLTVAGRSLPVTVAIDGDTVHVHLAGDTWSLTHRHPLQRAEAEAGGGAQDAAHAPMPGTVVSVTVSAGAAVSRGDTLLVIESMKLETTISAWRDGVVDTVHVTIGQVFDRGAPLVSLTPTTAQPADRPPTGTGETLQPDGASR